MNETDKASPIQDPLAFLAGGGEMGERTRAFDWSKTPVGPVADWPQSLKIAVRIMLTSRQPFCLCWGKELTFLYNDPYKSIVGGKHPHALGQPAPVVWEEIWDDLGPMVATAMSGDVGTYVEAQLLIMERNGYSEETYYTFSYSPIPDDAGRAGGIICANTEDTQRVVGERQLALLRELASGTTDARTWKEACEQSARALRANARDLPFALIYAAEPDGRGVSLVAASGIERGNEAAPETVPLDGASAWPFAEVLGTHSVRLVRDLATTFGDKLPTGDWLQSPLQAAVLPIPATGETGRAGALVVGLNPFRLFDDAYEGFLGLVARQIAASIANAQAYEGEKRRAEALAELDRSKTAFFSNVSHEFRTPLTLMLGPVEDLLARSHTDLTPAAAGQLEVVNRNGLRLLRLVNSLLDFSRIEAGRVRAVYQPTDLATFTADLASVFRAACERAGLGLVVDCPRLTEPVFVDREMWEKVVLNLVSNAFKFTLDGEIAVSLRQTGNAAQLRVRDTGTGIPAVEMPRLFERFHRVQSARGRTHEGTGIGLALVQELVKLHDGSVTAESAVGKGTTFVVSVPLGSAHLPADQIGDGPAAVSTGPGATPYVEEALRWLPDDDQGRHELPNYREPLPSPHRPSVPDGDDDRPRVLVADDNADMRQYVVRLLSEQFRVEAVPDGEAALAAARRQRPDLILTDVMMPKLNGFGLLKELRANAHTKSVPVIMLSARAGEESRVEGMEAGADDYLVKPFSARELLARVSAHLQMARLRRESERAVWESEGRLRALVNATSDVVYRMGPDWAEMRFLQGREFMADTDDPTRSWLDKYIHPDDQPRVMAVIREAVHTKSDFQLEHRVLRADGSLGWTLSRAVPLLDAAGEIVEWFGAASDITARKQAEADLRQSEERLRLALDTGRLGSWQLDLATGRLDCSPTCKTNFGLPPDSDLDYDRLTQLVHTDDRDRMRAAVRAAIDGQSDYEIEYRVVWPGDGSIRWVAIRGRAVYAGDGTPLRMAGVSLDITDRQRAESLRGGQKHVLEMVATGRPLPDVLAAACRVIEEQEPGLLCSVLLPDETRRHTQMAVGPSLPDSYLRGLEGLRTDEPHIGSCGAVLDCGEIVVVPDVEADERFAPEWRALLTANGLRSCRSIPVFGTGGTVLASFAIYRREAGDPAPANDLLVQTATHLAGIAIERQRVENVLRTSEERFRTLFESMDEGYCVIEMIYDEADRPADYRFVELNPAFVKHTGLTNAVGRTMRYFAPAHEAFWFDTYGRVARTGESSRFINEAKALGRWYDVYAFRFGGDGSNKVAILFTDISERKRIEAEREATQNTLAALVERCPFGIYIVDDDFRILTMNAGSQVGAFANVRPVIGRPFDEAMRILWPEPVAADIIKNFRYTLDTGEPYCSKDFVNPRADIDQTEGYEWELHRITLPGGRYGVVCYYYDATKLRHVERELKEADQKKDEFLATLAHELRNPLAPLRNGLQIMKLAGGDGNAVEKSRSMMERQVGQMAHLIDDLMDLSRISRGKIALQKTRLRLADAIQDAVDIARPLIEERGHDFTIDVPPEPIYVDADRTRLAQVFSNLLNNSAKYTDRGGRIRLAVGRQSGDVVVSVEDNGVGIPAHMLTRVFDMFAQVDRSLEKSQGGLGIGLNIVKRLVQMHDGGIVVESGGHGAGSRFVVCLPVVLAVTTDTTNENGDGEAKSVARRRILVADDNRVAASSLALLLGIMGNETQTAHDGLEALEVGAAFKPDVVLLDIGMPKLNGLDTCRRIRQQPWGRNIVVVACTGWGQEDDRRQSQEAGFDFHMVKPVDPASFEKLLAEMQIVAG